MIVEQEQLEMLFLKSIKSESEEVVKVRFDTLVKVCGFDNVVDSYVKVRALCQKSVSK